MDNSFTFCEELAENPRFSEFGGREDENASEFKRFSISDYYPDPNMPLHAPECLGNQKRAGDSLLNKFSNSEKSMSGKTSSFSKDFLIHHESLVMRLQQIKPQHFFKQKMDNQNTINLFNAIDDPELFAGLEVGLIKKESPAEDAPEEKIDSDAPAPSDGLDCNAAPPHHHPFVFSEAINFESDDFDRSAAPLSEEFLMPPEPLETKFSPMQIPSSDLANPNALKRRSRAQMEFLSDEEKKHHTLVRNRVHSANYVLRGKENLNSLEEKQKDLEAELRKLRARNNAHKAILDSRGMEWRSMEKSVIQPIALEHQHSLQEKEESVNKLIAEFPSIDEQATRSTKPGTLASKRSRTNRKLKTAELERDVLSYEVNIMQEEALLVGLEELLKEDAVYVSHFNSNSLHPTHQLPATCFEASRIFTSTPLSQRTLSEHGVSLLQHRPHPLTHRVHHPTHSTSGTVVRTHHTPEHQQ